MRYLSCMFALGPRLSRTFWIVILLLCLSASLMSQSAPMPTVTFTLDFPGSEPSHYVISVASDGKASYVGNGSLVPGGNSNSNSSSDSEDEKAAPEPPFHADFTASSSLITRVFDLAKKANYFQSQIETKKKNMANTGAKTLTYKDASHNTQANYNYSPVVAVQELTRIFQNLSSTIEFGHRLDFYHHHQKLALDNELKRMEDFSKSGSLEEVSAVAPVLQKIVDDKSVINVVRMRAQRIMAGPETKQSAN
jgi:hypothetical protein